MLAILKILEAWDLLLTNNITLNIYYVEVLNIRRSLGSYLTPSYNSGIYFLKGYLLVDEKDISLIHVASGKGTLAQ